MFGSVCGYLKKVICAIVDFATFCETIITGYHQNLIGFPDFFYTS